MTDRPLQIAKELLALPTAPFAEELPIAYLRAFAGGTAGLHASVDGAGNVVVRTSDRREPHPLVFVAHLDHPGFDVDGVDRSNVTMRFAGGLAARAVVAGTPVDLLRRGSPEPVGRATLTSVSERDGWLTGALAHIEHGEAVLGGFATWAFPALPTGVEVADARITARACDDLLGAAATLAALETAAATGGEAWGLFTRAEEVGLLGAFEAIRLGSVPPDATVLSLECSKALADAPQGGGAIVRVGDRRSIFDPALSEAVRATAEAAGVAHQRKLMDGGVCEASAFGAAGYRASGVAVALGNYHNAADDGTGVALEHVAVADYLAEVALLDALVADPPAPGPGQPGWLAERTATARGAFDRALAR